MQTQPFLWVHGCLIFSLTTVGMILVACSSPPPPPINFHKNTKVRSSYSIIWLLSSNLFQSRTDTHIFKKIKALSTNAPLILTLKILFNSTPLKTFHKSYVHNFVEFLLSVLFFLLFSTSSSSCLELCSSHGRFFSFDGDFRHWGASVEQLAQCPLGYAPNQTLFTVFHCQHLLALWCSRCSTMLGVISER